MNFLNNSCACGSNQEAIKLFETRDHNFQVTSESSWIMKCPECDSLFSAIFPSNESLFDAYKTYYTKPKSRRGLRKILRLLVDLTRSTHIIRDAPKSVATVLDYGCGSGEYLNLLAEQGYKAQLFGTDITQPRSADPEVFQWIALDKYDQNGHQYDWITLSHVIEHVPDPMSVLIRLSSCCSVGGRVWLSTPNAQSVLISVFQGNARDVDFPRHRQIYSRKCLVQLLSAAGFEVKQLPSPRIDALMNYVSCARNLLNNPSIGAVRKVITLCTDLLRLTCHLLKPAAWRMEDSPEIVLVGKLKQRIVVK